MGPWTMWHLGWWHSLNEFQPCAATRVTRASQHVMLSHVLCESWWTVDELRFISIFIETNVGEMCAPLEIKSSWPKNLRTISNRVFVPYSLNLLVKIMVSSVMATHFFCCPGAGHCHENGPGPEEKGEKATLTSRHTGVYLKKDMWKHVFVYVVYVCLKSCFLEN